MRPIKNHISLKINNLNFSIFVHSLIAKKVLKTRFYYYHFDREINLFHIILSK
nr:MAG TPA: hypothetical protein [Caudoviricetes sp.]